VVLVILKLQRAIRQFIIQGVIMAGATDIGEEAFDILSDGEKGQLLEAAIQLGQRMAVDYYNRGEEGIGYARNQIGMIGTSVETRVTFLAMQIALADMALSNNPADHIADLQRAIAQEQLLALIEYLNLGITVRGPSIKVYGTSLEASQAVGD
jgi:hypothetical protein